MNDELIFSTRKIASITFLLALVFFSKLTDLAVNVRVLVCKCSLDLLKILVAYAGQCNKICFHRSGICCLLVF